MCALTPLVPENLGWPQLYQTYTEAESFSGGFESLFHSPPPLPQAIQLDRCASFTGNNNNDNNYDNCNNFMNMNDDYISGDQSMVVKKQIHNANERDRRKKLSALYLSLRSLLPLSDRKKKLSIPDTVSRVLKYIPELQQEVKILHEKKEKILKTISQQARDSESAHEEKQREREISTIPKKIPLPAVLVSLEEYGLYLISASSSASSGSRIFHNLHLEMDRGSHVKCEELSQKLSSLHAEKTELIH